MSTSPRWSCWARAHQASEHVSPPPPPPPPPPSPPPPPARAPRPLQPTGGAQPRLFPSITAHPHLLDAERSLLPLLLRTPPAPASTAAAPTSHHHWMWSSAQRSRTKRCPAAQRSSTKHRPTAFQPQTPPHRLPAPLDKVRGPALPHQPPPTIPRSLSVSHGRGPKSRNEWHSPPDQKHAAPVPPAARDANVTGRPAGVGSPPSWRALRLL